MTLWMAQVLRRWLRRLPACAWLLSAALSLLIHPASANEANDRSRQKSAAEAERAQLREKLSALKRDIGRTETAQDSALSTLAASEEAISNANRSLHELSQEQKQAEAKLQQLSNEQARLSKTTAEQQQRLARLLREHYVAGNEDRVKLLLSGDNPNRINRELQYMGYISQAQAKLIDNLRASLALVESNKAEIKTTRESLAEIEREEREHKVALEQQKARHAQLLAQLSAKLAAQRQEAGRLQRDEERLGGLVEQLGKLIEEQKRAEAQKKAEAQEKRRQQQLARAKAEQERKQARPAPRGTPANPDAIDDVEPPKVAEVADGHGPSGSFASLRGKLKAPVQGTVTAKYGSKRPEGPSWKGWFIRAAEGAEIRSVAGGKVIFAEWLRGFGNLIIIDHGNQYLTIYGNNQALLKHAGDPVKAGEAIASAGNSGGNEQSGLYFEMRHQGRAFDPLGWVTIR